MKARHTIAAALVAPLAMAACGPTVETTATMTPETTTTEATTETNTRVLAADATPDASIFMLPAGTQLHVRLMEPVGVMNRAENEFIRAEVIDPLITELGETAIPVGTILSGVSHGPVMARSPHPTLLRLDFESLTFEGLTYPIDSRVVSVDLALADSDVSTPMPSRAMAGSPEAMTPGAIIHDPNGQLSNLEFAYEEGTIISLGDDSDAMLPEGARMVVELVTDTQLHSSPD